MFYTLSRYYSKLLQFSIFPSLLLRLIFAILANLIILRLILYRHLTLIMIILLWSRFQHGLFTDWEQYIIVLYDSPPFSMIEPLTLEFTFFLLQPDYLQVSWCNKFLWRRKVFVSQRRLIAMPERNIWWLSASDLEMSARFFTFILTNCFNISKVHL